MAKPTHGEVRYDRVIYPATKYAAAREVVRSFVYANGVWILMSVRDAAPPYARN